jgi:hypothetical protein
MSFNNVHIYEIYGANSEYCLSYLLCPLSFTSMLTSDKVANHFCVYTIFYLQFLCSSFLSS